VPVLIGFGATSILTPAAVVVANRLGVVDRPVRGKIHKRVTPLLGGVAVFIGFCCATLFSSSVSPAVTGVIVGGLAAVVVGVLDEKYTLPPLVHLGGQVAAGTIAIVAGLGVVHSVSMPLGGLTSPGLALPGAVGVAFTLFWLVGMMNTVNFLDGLDGLAPGVAALAALLLTVWASEPQRFYLPSASVHDVLILSAALLGALLGFLPFNWNPARIFLGDSGSMFLGLSLGALSIVGPAKVGTALLVLIIPLLDVAWAIVRRRLKRRSFLAGDKQHVYHRMLELGMSHTSVVLLFYFLCLALGVLDLVLLKVFKLIAFLALAILLSGTFVLVEARATRKEREAQLRREEPAPGS
jgi:UDP-GlcNAc:undecaprenyl-phosphate GlcNAc-1-phosphate transferase